MSTDRAWLHRADMKRLSDWADASGRADVWRALTSTLEEQALRDLLRMLDRLQPPERIHELRTLEETQDRLGAASMGPSPRRFSGACLNRPTTPE